MADLSRYKREELYNQSEENIKISVKDFQDPFCFEKLFRNEYEKFKRKNNEITLAERAGVSDKTLQRCRNNINSISKRMIIRLCICMEVNIKTCETLLKAKGYHFIDSFEDCVFKWILTNNKGCNINDCNDIIDESNNIINKIYNEIIEKNNDEKVKRKLEEEKSKVKIKQFKNCYK